MYLSRIIIGSLVFLGLILSCSPKKRAVTCINVDAETGACLDKKIEKEEVERKRKREEEKEQRIAFLTKQFNAAKQRLQQKKIELDNAASDDKIRLSKEYNAVVTEMGGYAGYLKFSYGINKYGEIPDKVFVPTPPLPQINLHITRDEGYKSLLKLSSDEEVENLSMHYRGEQRKYVLEFDRSAASDIEVSLIVSLSFAGKDYCGSVSIDDSEPEANTVVEMIEKDDEC